MKNIHISTHYKTVASTTKSASKSRAQRMGWLSLGAAILLTACAGVTPSTPEVQITQRANARWQHLVAKDFDKAYEYTTPGLRAVVTPDVYRGRFGSAVIWLGAEVVRVECAEAEKCKATLRLDYRSIPSRAGEKLSTHIDETWVKEAGQWWIHQSISGN